jgi:hypothetical protein
VRWGCEVVSVDAESGRIGLAGGEVVEADLVIGLWLRSFHVGCWDS